MDDRMSASEQDELDSLDPQSRARLLQHASRLKHDLGKYIALQQRWLPAEASRSDRLDALRSDLLHTRRGPDGSVDAHTVWTEFAPGLEELARDRDVVHMTTSMGVLATVIADLRADVSVDLDAAGAACTAVSDAVRSLVARLRC